MKESEFNTDRHNRPIQKSELKTKKQDQSMKESELKMDQHNRPIQKSELDIDRLYRPIQSEDWIGIGRSINRTFRPPLLRHVNFVCRMFHVSLQRYDSTDFGPILQNTFFHIVGSRTLWLEMIMSWGKQLTYLPGVGGGGWRKAQHMWDGQGLKDPFFFWKFF